MAPPLLSAQAPSGSSPSPAPRGRRGRGVGGDVCWDEGPVGAAELHRLRPGAGRPRRPPVGEQVHPNAPLVNQVMLLRTQNPTVGRVIRPAGGAWMAWCSWRWLGENPQPAPVPVGNTQPRSLAL